MEDDATRSQRVTCNDKKKSNDTRVIAASTMQDPMGKMQHFIDTQRMHTHTFSPAHIKLPF